MKKVVLGSILALLVGCASVQPNDPVAINDALVGFTVNSQGKHWPEALSFVTPDEAEEITDENGLMKEEYRLAASRLRISALKQMPWRVDGRGRLIGIKDVLDDFNKKYIVSEEKSSVEEVSVVEDSPSYSSSGGRSSAVLPYLRFSSSVSLFV